MKALDTRFLKLILAVLIILFVFWLKSISRHEWIQPAY